jgi:uncharacterized protein (TIGR00730 family)
MEMETKEQSIEEVRRRLQQLLDEYLEVESELRALEDTDFRVCLFGSARIRPQDPTYKEIYRLARELGAFGMDIVTGGGPGLMEAANRGVQDARSGRSKSYGLPILLPRSDEVANKHLDIKSEHKRFSSRLDEFMRLSHAVVVAPGGIGTLLELAYVWQLIQVGLLEKRPVILLGTRFWEGLLEWMREQQLGKAYIGPHDFDCIRMVDSTDEAVALLREEQLRFEELHAGAAAPEAVEEARSHIQRTTEHLLSELKHAKVTPPSTNGRNGHHPHVITRNVRRGHGGGPNGRHPH